MLRDNRNVHIFQYRGWFHFVWENVRETKAKQTHWLSTL